MTGKVMLDKYQAAADRRARLPGMCDGKTTIWELGAAFERDASAITNDLASLSAKGYKFEFPTKPGRTGGKAKMPLFIRFEKQTEARATATEGGVSVTTDCPERSEAFLRKYREAAARYTALARARAAA